MTLATFGKLLLCLYACALVYRYHRNTMPSDYHINIQRAKIRGENLNVLTGSHEPALDLIKDGGYRMINLGKAEAIGFSDRGALLFTNDDKEDRDGPMPFAIRVRHPDGKIEPIENGVPALLGDGRIALRASKQVLVDGKAIATEGPNITRIEPIDQLLFYNYPTPAGTEIMFYGSRRAAVVSARGEANIINLEEAAPITEPFWKTVGRTIGIFNPIRQVMVAEHAQFSESGSVYATFSEQTELYGDPPNPPRVLHRFTANGMIRIAYPDSFSADYQAPIVGLDDSALFNELAPNRDQRWPYLFDQSVFVKLPLPEGENSGGGVAIADKDTFLMLCEQTPLGTGRLYLRRNGKFFRVPDQPGGARASYRVPGPESSGETYICPRPISKSGAFAAKSGENLILFTPKTLSP